MIKIYVHLTDEQRYKTKNSCNLKRIATIAGVKYDEFFAIADPRHNWMEVVRNCWNPYGLSSSSLGIFLLTPELAKHQLNR